MYLIPRTSSVPAGWDACEWEAAAPLQIAHFHPRGSDHRPVTEARLLHDDVTIYARFRVDDRFVRAVHSEYDSDTYKDSCVELFVQPPGRSAYFALEVNCGGAFSLRYILDPTRTPNRFAWWTTVSPAEAGRIGVMHSLPTLVEPEMQEPVTWWVQVAWPREVMEAYCGPLGRLSGHRWRGNAFKCGDETSHPHWASWRPIGEALNFHQPQYFGELAFE